MKSEEAKSLAQLFTLEEFKQFLLNLKEFPEFFLFASMIKKSWYVWLRTSSFFVFLTPLIAVSLIGMAILEGYRFFLASNKNIDRLWSFTVAIVCAPLAVSAALQATFGLGTVAAPWLFFSALLIFDISLLFALSVSFLRILESPAGSSQQRRFIRQAIEQTFAFVSVLSVMACLAVGLLFPASTAVVVALATVSAAFILLNVAWRFLPPSFKDKAKTLICLNDTQIGDIVVEERWDERARFMQVNFIEGSRGFPTRFFTAPDYLSQIKGIALHHLKRSFLSKRLEEYVERLDKNKSSPRTSVKKRLAFTMLKNMKQAGLCEPIPTLNCNEFPFYAQSFWRDSEMGSLVKAYNFLALAPVLSCGVTQKKPL